MNRVTLVTASAQAEDGRVEIRRYPFRAYTEIGVVDSNLSRQAVVELDSHEVARVRETMEALSVRRADRVPGLLLETPGLRLSVRYTNMGEPFREGAYVSIEDNGTEVTVFIERSALAELAKSSALSL